MEDVLAVTVKPEKKFNCILRNKNSKEYVKNDCEELRMSREALIMNIFILVMQIIYFVHAGQEKFYTIEHIVHTSQYRFPGTSRLSPSDSRF